MVEGLSPPGLPKKERVQWPEREGGTEEPKEGMAKTDRYQSRRDLIPDRGVSLL